MNQNRRNLRAEVDRLRAERDVLLGSVERVEALLSDADDPYIHTHPEGEGDSDCAGCWEHDIRIALDGAES